MPLIPQVHKLTKKELSRGGQSRSLAKKLAQRKNCNSKCQIYTRCPFRIISEKKYDGKCAYNQQDLMVRERILNLFDRGEDGVITEIQGLIFKLISVTELTAKEIKDTVVTLINYKDSVYGKRIKQELSGEVRTGYTAEDLRRVYEEVHGKNKRRGA